MQLETSKTDITDVRIAELDACELSAGQVRLTVDRFGYSANNITYAAAGETLKYWDFFPTGTEGWGIVPVWGYADVAASNCDGIEVGARYFGYWPSGDSLVVQPAKVKPERFFDASAHRSELATTYNFYRRADQANSDAENRHMLLFPLYITSWCLWDALVKDDWFGAKRIAIASASSKTAIGLAFALSQDENAPEVVGLTSPANTGFVEGLHLHDTVLTYDDLETLDPSVPTAIVDMSGNATTIGRLHTHLGDAMRQTLDVGLTHWEAPRRDDARIRDRSTFFFAPAHIAARSKEWGADEFARRTNAFMMAATEDSKRWMEVDILSGLDALADLHPKMARGGSDPANGFVIAV